MQTVFAEKTEDRSLDDNRHIGELFFIRMYWEKGRIPSGNILYWKDAKREDAQINFTGFDGLLLYLDPFLILHIPTTDFRFFSVQKPFLFHPFFVSFTKSFEPFIFYSFYSRHSQSKNCTKNV